MSVRDAVIQVLQEAGQPLHADKITEMILTRGASPKVSLPDRDALSLVFAAAAPGAPVRVDNAKVTARFLSLLYGSNTGTSGEPDDERGAKADNAS